MDEIPVLDRLQLDIPFSMLSDPAAAAMFVILYLLPSIIALGRGTPKPVVVFICNIAFGWTIVGWILILVFALRRSVHSVD